MIIALARVGHKVSPSTSITNIIEFVTKPIIV